MFQKFIPRALIGTISVVCHNIIWLHGCVSILYVAYDMATTILLSWEQTFRSKEEIDAINNSVGINSTNIVDSVSSFSDSVAMSNILNEQHWDEQCLCEQCWDGQ